MDVALDKNGFMSKKLNKSIYETQYCPNETDEAHCGNWCPRFIIDNDKKTVTIYCGCAPISYNITQDERGEQ